MNNFTHSQDGCCAMILMQSNFAQRCAKPGMELPSLQMAKISSAPNARKPLVLRELTG
jgi:hypothetical protein